MNAPSAITLLSEALSSLPGVGPKMANRLAIYVATEGKSAGENLSRNLREVADSITICNECGNLAEGGACAICSSDERDTTILMVVESPMDLIQIEQVGDYSGEYLVLGKLISPINGVGPEDINLNLLRTKIQINHPKEVILALSSTVEGEATALYILDILKSLEDEMKISKLAQGLPTGVDIEYLDSGTLKGALQGRVGM